MSRSRNESSCSAGETWWCTRPQSTRAATRRVSKARIRRCGHTCRRSCKRRNGRRRRRWICSQTGRSSGPPSSQQNSTSSVGSPCPRCSCRCSAMPTSSAAGPGRLFSSTSELSFPCKDTIHAGMVPAVGGEHEPVPAVDSPPWMPPALAPPRSDHRRRPRLDDGGRGSEHRRWGWGRGREEGGLESRTHPWSVLGSLSRRTRHGARGAWRRPRTTSGDRGGDRRGRTQLSGVDGEAGAQKWSTLPS